MKRLFLSALALSGLLSFTSAQAPALTIDTQLQGKTQAEKVSIKSDEIVQKMGTGTFVDPLYGETVKIQKIEKIQGGIQVFAQAWKGGKQLGLGSDGTTDIERFRIFNPPVLVADPSGAIDHSYTDEKGHFINRKLRDDPAEAIRQTLAHTIHVASQDGSRIVPGKVGNTTSTFFPDPSVETTTIDGVCNSGNNAVWSASQTASPGAACNHTNGAAANVTYADASDGSTYDILRAYFLFDTSSIGSGQSVSSATFSLWVTTATDQQADGSDYVNVYTSTPASNTALATTDFPNVGSTAQATQITISALTTAAYNDFAFNSTGKGNIAMTGVSKFSLRDGHDAANVSMTFSHINLVKGDFADTAGTANDPKLVVVSAAAAATTKPRAIVF